MNPACPKCDKEMSTRILNSGRSKTIIHTCKCGFEKMNEVRTVTVGEYETKVVQA